MNRPGTLTHVLSSFPGYKPTLDALQLSERWSYGPHSQFSDCSGVGHHDNYYELFGADDLYKDSHVGNAPIFIFILFFSLREEEVKSQIGILKFPKAFEVSTMLNL